MRNRVGARSDDVRRRTATNGSKTDALRVSSWQVAVRRPDVLSAIAALAAVMAACGRAPVEKLDPAKVDALRSTLEQTAVEPTPRPLPSPRKSAAPARSAKQQRARAQAALPPGHVLGALTPIGRDGRFAFALDAPREQKPEQGATLSLMDLGAEPGALVAAHDFGETGFLAGGQVEVVGALELRDENGRELLLADLRSGRGEAAVCGWWLSADRPRLVCAPVMSRRSDHSVWLDMLLESWEADSPTRPVHPPGTTGRVLGFSGGGWREIDSFRCLGWKLDRALREAGTEPLGKWQRTAAESRRTAALAAADRHETPAALALLRDAVDLDGCDVETWRLLGRLDLGSGHVAAAVPSLAVAVALRPHGEAALVDLADALVALEREGGGGEAWSTARQVLSNRKGTKALLDQAKGERPSDLARVLYEQFIAQTERSAPYLGAQRRHAREQIGRLPAAVSPKSPAPSPTAAR
jgi:hypothetical protein